MNRIGPEKESIRNSPRGQKVPLPVSAVCRTWLPI